MSRKWRNWYQPEWGWRRNKGSWFQRRQSTPKGAISNFKRAWEDGVDDVDLTRKESDSAVQFYNKAVIIKDPIIPQRHRYTTLRNFGTFLTNSVNISPRGRICTKFGTGISVALSHRLTVNVMLSNITVLWFFCVFYITPLKLCTKCSFYIYRPTWCFITKFERVVVVVILKFQKI